MTTQTAKSGTRYLRGALIALIVVLAFVASYQIAVAAGPGGGASSDSIASGALIPAVNGGADGSTPACACCGTSGTGETTEGAAALEGDVQRITVDTANGYDPNVIKLAAGVPAEITFKQASGCMAEVVSEDLGFYEDLTTGDKTIRLEAEVLQPGTYAFSCGMQMVFGTIIVE